MFWVRTPDSGVPSWHSQAQRHNVKRSSRSWQNELGLNDITFFKGVLFTLISTSKKYIMGEQIWNKTYCKKGGGRQKIIAKNLQKALICFEGSAANELAPGGLVRSSLAKYSKYFLNILPSRFTNICKHSTANIWKAFFLQIRTFELEKVLWVREQ